MLENRALQQGERLQPRPGPKLKTKTLLKVWPVATHTFKKAFESLADQTETFKDCKFGQTLNNYIPVEVQQVVTLRLPVRSLARAR